MAFLFMMQDVAQPPHVYQLTAAGTGKEIVRLILRNAKGGQASIQLFASFRRSWQHRMGSSRLSNCLSGVAHRSYIWSRAPQLQKKPRSGESSGASQALCLPITIRFGRPKTHGSFGLGGGLDDRTPGLIEERDQPDGEKPAGRRCARPLAPDPSLHDHHMG